MPRTKSSTKKLKHTKSRAISSSRLVNLLNTISNNRRAMSKAEINLPARLMQQPLEYSKTVSSTFTSSMHNGELHTAGKEVINDSTQPFIQVAELHNGKLEHYMIPRNQAQASQTRHPSRHPNRHTKAKKNKKSSKKSRKPSRKPNKL